ncbi:hypothetical protein NG798_27635 [Ancylothrix sp. C2]|uniref:hypothetical protein n=1 Tax=Ancylothrix sp. D3o TaxID=2953691 RepID=UPI0021BA42D9|nr:hypothetical protein [Ancylothrix sp. D3o]MCT7953573.1 hypothetical protein [Ancylothrix sp. D3o]
MRFKVLGRPVVPVVPVDLQKQVVAGKSLKLAKSLAAGGGGQAGDVPDRGCRPQISIKFSFSEETPAFTDAPAS